MKDIKKRYILKKVIPSIILLIAVFAGIIKINITNTKTLSPLGNTKENYDIVSEEFGKDFSNFIKDNCMLKIYCDKDDDVLVRINDSNYKINTNLSFLDGVKKKIDELMDYAKNI